MFRLALSLGYTVRDLQNRIDSRELTEWIAFYNIEPFGEDRADMRQALTSCILANANRDPKKSRAFKPQDFMLVKPPKKEQTPEEMMALLKGICRT